LALVVLVEPTVVILFSLLSLQLVVVTALMTLRELLLRVDQAVAVAVLAELLLLVVLVHLVKVLLVVMVLTLMLVVAVAVLVRLVSLVLTLVE
jgi:hypothetical protein